MRSNTYSGNIMDTLTTTERISYFKSLIRFWKSVLARDTHHWGQSARSAITRYKRKLKKEVEKE